MIPVSLPVWTVLVLALSLRGQDGFVPTETPDPWPPATLSVIEPGGTELRVSDGGITRRRAEGSTVLACTDPAGTGAIAGLALHPFGATFVAAENGLFVTDPVHDVLDKPGLSDGVPPGRPIGLHIDGEGRLWLATDSAFGVVDTRQFFGRTFTAADGMPETPFTGFAVLDDGRMLLRNAQGVFTYTPGRGSAPVGRARQPGDAGATPSTTILGEADGTASLELAGTALGGATFRFRLRGQHLLRPLDDGRLAGLNPGRHGVEIWVHDRELRGVKVADLVVDVPFPRVFDKGVLLPLAGLGGLLLLALFGWRARRMGGGRGRYGKAVLSAGIAGIVGLQILAGILGYGRSWPFVGFSMYTETYREGSVLYKPVLIGLWEDGRAREIALNQAGLEQDGYWQLFGELIYGDRTEGDRLIEGYNSRHRGDPLLGFEIRTERTRLTPGGPVRVAPIVMVRRGP